MFVCSFRCECCLREKEMEGWLFHSRGKRCPGKCEALSRTDHSCTQNVMVMREKRMMSSSPWEVSLELIWGGNRRSRCLMNSLPLVRCLQSQTGPWMLIALCCFSRIGEREDLVLDKINNCLNYKMKKLLKYMAVWEQQEIKDQVSALPSPGYSLQQGMSRKKGGIDRRGLEPTPLWIGRRVRNPDQWSSIT